MDCALRLFSGSAAIETLASSVTSLRLSFLIYKIRIVKPGSPLRTVTKIKSNKVRKQSTNKRLHDKTSLWCWTFIQHQCVHDRVGRAAWILPLVWKITPGEGWRSSAELIRLSLFIILKITLFWNSLRLRSCKNVFPFFSKSWQPSSFYLLHSAWCSGTFFDLLSSNGKISVLCALTRYLALCQHFIYVLVM